MVWTRMCVRGAAGGGEALGVPARSPRDNVFQRAEKHAVEGVGWVAPPGLRPPRRP